jgi:hypothetical protein
MASVLVHCRSSNRAQADGAHRETAQGQEPKRISFPAFKAQCRLLLALNPPCRSRLRPHQRSHKSGGEKIPGLEVITSLHSGLEGVGLVAGEILQHYDTVFNATRCWSPGEQLHTAKEIRLT